MKGKLLLLATLAAVMLPVGCAAAKSKMETRYDEGLRPFTLTGLEQGGMTALWEQNLTIEEAGIEVEVKDVYLYDTILLVACRDSSVYAFDRRTGEKLWITLLPVPFKYAPTLFEGEFFGVCGRRLIKIDREGGMGIGPEMKASISAPFHMTEENLYAPGSDGGIHKLDRQNLLLVWPAPARGAGVILGRPAPLGAYVVFGNTAGEIIGIDSITGGRHIYYKARDSVSAGVVTDEEFIYAGSTDFYVYCITLNNAVRWKQIVQGQVTRAPVISGDRLYVSPIGAGVLALDKQTGGILWKNHGAQVFLANGRGWVFAQGPEKELWTLEDAKGLTIERLDVSEFSFLPVNKFNDGLVYLVSPRGRIVCVTAK